MQLNFSQRIESDLNAILEFATEYSPARADRLARMIREKLRRIAANPRLYRVRHELGEDLRLAVVDRYVLLYAVEENAIRIERIVYGGRDLPSLLE